MAGAISNTETQWYAVVTGANKGLGLEICRQLASKGITVVLTARDEKRGIEAVEKLKGSGIPEDHVVFHQLDVVDPSSVASLAAFVKAKFGKLDILVNNAGISGVRANWEGIVAAATQSGGAPSNLDETTHYLLEKLDSLSRGAPSNLGESITQTYELAEECLQTNYYGAKRMVEAFVPLLQLSDSPRIVNVSATRGKLQYIPNKWAKGVLNDVESLTEDRIDEVLNEFLKDFHEGLLEAKGWPAFLAAYTVSKAAVNAYTRVMAKKHPSFLINCVCPGFAKTDLNDNTGMLTAEEGAASPVRLALLPNDGPTGTFFFRSEVSSFVE